MVCAETVSRHHRLGRARPRMSQIRRDLASVSSLSASFAAIPDVCGAIAMMLWARLSDAGGERSWTSLRRCSRERGADRARVRHLFGADLHRGTLRGRGGHHVLRVHLLADPLELPYCSAAAGGLAIVSIGNLGGFVGAYLIGHICEATELLLGADLVAWFLILAAILIRVAGISFQRSRTTQSAPARA